MSAVAAFRGRRVAVFGDAICDKWLFAEPRRLSREAPVMVLSHKEERLGAGGALVSDSGGGGDPKVALFVLAGVGVCLGLFHVLDRAQADAAERAVDD